MAHSPGLPTPDPSIVLSCAELTIQAGPRPLVRGLGLALQPGTLLAVLGPNGSGKSLTLHTLAGLRPPAGGRVHLDGRDLSGYRRREAARRLTLLLQDDSENFPASVLESVLLGRHPHRLRWSGPTAHDLTIARRALDDMELGDFLERDTTSLSGGERRRLAVARVLAQDTPVLLLDEPTNHLDPRHQIRVMARLAGLAAEGRAVMVSLHDPSLAMRFAATTLLLHGNGTWTLGPTAEILNVQSLERLFATPYEDFHSRENQRAVLPRVPAA